MCDNIRSLTILEDIKLSGNHIREDDEADNTQDDMSLSDNSTLITAKPSITTTTSTAKLLRKTNSKASLDNNPHKSKANIRRSSLKSKYANMSLEKALLLACPTLLTLEGMTVERDEKDAKNNDDGFHTW